MKNRVKNFFMPGFKSSAHVVVFCGVNLILIELIRSIVDIGHCQLHEVGCYVNFFLFILLYNFLYLLIWCTIIYLKRRYIGPKNHKDDIANSYNES